MQAKTIIAGLLSIAAGTSMAAPLTWQFTYTGFFDELAGHFDPTHTLRGEFTAEDRNGDGAIEFNELSTMIIYGERNYKGCQGEESPYWACGVGPFDFDPVGGLHFSLGEEFHDRPRQQGAGHTIDTGDRDWSYRIVDGVFIPHRFYTWTPATTFQVTVVPEPGGWAMLAAGGAAVMALGARRRRRGR